MSKSKGLDVVRIERITQVISVLRGHRVLLDGDLAELYAAFEVTICDLKKG